MYEYLNQCKVTEFVEFYSSNIVYPWNVNFLTLRKSIVLDIDFAGHSQFVFARMALRFYEFGFLTMWEKYRAF